MHKSIKLGGIGAHQIGSIKDGVYGGKIAGLYDLEETLGRGHFAVVKLARHVFTGEKVAVKVIDKSKLDPVSKAHLFQEVRCMKLVQHPNVVRLYEVIDTATKLYLILELGDGGDLYDYIMRHDSGLDENVAREYFTQIVRAITYCHKLHVVHRDLKPENVVFFEKLGVVKLTDFGFSNKFSPGQKLETSCGSLAYSAPEILLGDSYDAPAVDVWSLGVILYMLVCGQAPFHEANDSETLTMIMDCKYTVPVHISNECKDLISRMLVRAPEKRATLAEIAAHSWLSSNEFEQPLDILPLVSKEQLTEDDHNLIVQKMVNGSIATKEEIQECVDKGEYNHITATYFLLAERKLRSKRQAQVSKRPEKLLEAKNSGSGATTLTVPTPSLLSVPRTPGDVPQRSRKCSIVQEDEEEEDITAAGREDLSSGHNSLNRRGSRSEGRINIALQERLAESEKRKKEEKCRAKPGPVCSIKTIESRPKSAHETLSNVTLPIDGNNCTKCAGGNEVPSLQIPTTIITEASTITIPINANAPVICQTVPKYKTMPSPTRNLDTSSPLQQLNEIFEEGDGPTLHRKQLVNRSRGAYEQRRSKATKTRTASCSSSDASDDDSENRKKRAHKINTTSSTKPLQPRRDSYDDSSDSQEPGGGGATAGNATNGSSFVTEQGNSNRTHSSDTKSNSGNGGAGGRKHNNDPGNNGALLGRRNKVSRRRSSETRLRESQSLNRITEEESVNNLAVNVAAAAAAATTATTTTTAAAAAATTTPKTKSFGSKFLGFAIGSAKRPASEHYSRKEATKIFDESKLTDLREEKENKKESAGGGGSKKMRLLGRYLQVHKRLFVPLPSLFGRNKLYKARSCGSLTRDRINSAPEDVLQQQRKAVSVIRNSIGSTSDINQNMGGKTEDTTTTNLVLVKNVTVGLTNMCVHLGPASKCTFC